MTESFDQHRNVWRFIKKFEQIENTDYPDAIKSKIPVIIKALKNIIDNEETYFNFCKITWSSNVDLINIHAERSVSSSNYLDESIVFSMLLAIYRLISEKVLLTGETFTESESPVMLLFTYGSTYTDRANLVQIEIWRNKLQSDTVMRRANDFVSQADITLNKVKSIKEEIELKSNVFSDTFKNSEDRLEAYKNSVKGVFKDYNFVGLSSAFKHLIDEKKLELSAVNRNLKLFGLLPLLPLIISAAITAILWIYSTDPVNSLKDKLMFSAPILLPMEAILIYFFRIILKEQLSLKAQILQLELRYSVCAFIEGYADFTKEIPREKLEKFEALVFSGITPDPTAVPGTFDGMDQLINLAKAAGGK